MRLMDRRNAELRRIYDKYCSDNPSILSQEEYEYLCFFCREIAKSENIVWIKQYYTILLTAMYKGEQHGVRNHFTKLRNFFCALCPVECEELEHSLRNLAISQPSIH